MKPITLYIVNSAMPHNTKGDAINVMGADNVFIRALSEMWKKVFDSAIIALFFIGSL